MLEFAKTKQDFDHHFWPRGRLTPIPCAMLTAAGERKPGGAPVHPLRVLSARWSCCSFWLCMSGMTRSLSGFGQNTLKTWAFRGVGFLFSHKSGRIPLRFYNSEFYPCVRDVLGSFILSCLGDFKIKEIRGSHMDILQINVWR